MHAYHNRNDRTAFVGASTTLHSHITARRHTRYAVLATQCIVVVAVRERPVRRVSAFILNCEQFGFVHSQLCYICFAAR